MTINVEDLTNADKAAKPGDEVHIQITHEGRWHTGQFVGENVTGISILEGDRYKFFPWSNVISVYKEIVR